MFKEKLIEIRPKGFIFLVFLSISLILNFVSGSVIIGESVGQVIVISQNTGICN